MRALTLAATSRPHTMSTAARPNVAPRGARRLAVLLAVALLLSAVPVPGQGAQAQPASRATTAPAGLPEGVVGGYWTYWSAPRLRDVPVEFNTVYLFSARPVGGQPGSTGAVFFEQFVQSEASLVEDIALLRSQGRSVILSVGGAGEYLNIGSPARRDAFVESVVGIYERLGGFDGLDWNIESADLPVREMVEASQALKARFGQGFAITTPPAPWRVEEMAFVEALRDAGVLDLVTPQYYDLTGLSTEAARRDYAVETISRWVTAAGGADRVGFGFRNVGAASHTMTVESAVEVWERATARHPDLRGAMVWSIDLDRSIDYRFARDVGFLADADTSDASRDAGGPGAQGGGADDSGGHAAPTPAPGTFRDVPEGVHFPAIERMASAEVVEGYQDGTFRPADAVTRGQVATVLTRALELDVAGCIADCADLSDVDGTTHADGIRALIAAGAVDGFPDGTFRPGQQVTRAQFASMLATAFELPTPDGAVGFDDVRGSTHGSAIAALAEAGVTEGRGPSTFAPEDPVRRDQLATFLDRALVDR